jgi:post-segregation antitoxin (ccd killing protein)
MTKPRGRPRLDDGDTSQSATVTLTTKQYDRLCAEARRGDLSVSATIRRALEEQLERRRAGIKN